MKKLFLGGLLIFLVMPIFGKETTTNYFNDEVIYNYASFLDTLQGEKDEDDIESVKAYVEKNRGDKFQEICIVGSSYGNGKDFYCFFDPFLFPSIEEKYFLAYGEDFIKQWILGEIYWVVVEIPHQEAVEYFPFQNKALAMEFCYEYKTATSFLGETAKMGAINDSAERVTNLVFEKLDTHYYTKLSNFYDDGKLERWHVLQTELKE